MNYALAFASFAVTAVSVGAVGILADEPTSSVILLVGMAVVTGTLLPWSPWWQLLGVTLVAATGIWTVATIVQTPHRFWVEDIGASVPTLGSTVFIRTRSDASGLPSSVPRASVAAGQESLREVNRRLEQEIQEHQQEVQEHQRTEDALRFAMRELDHRVKNTLATVQAVADQTLRASCSMSEFGEAFDGRIKALARIHTALAARRWEGLWFASSSSWPWSRTAIMPIASRSSATAASCRPSWSGSSA